MASPSVKNLRNALARRRKGAIPTAPQSKLAITLFLLTIVVCVLVSGHLLLAVTLYFLVAGVTVLQIRKARGTGNRAVARHRLFWLGPTAMLVSITVAGIIGRVAVALLRSDPASLTLLRISDTFLAAWDGILFVVLVGFMRHRKFKNALIALPLSFLPYLALPTSRSGADLFVFLLMQVTACATCVLLLMRFGPPLRTDQSRPA